MSRLVMVATAIIVLGGLAGNFLRFSEQTPRRGPDFEQIAYDGRGYQGEEQRFSDDSYAVLQADTTTLRKYSDSAGNVYWLFVAYFASQKYGSQMHSPRHCLPGGGWNLDQSDKCAIASAASDTIVVNQTLISHGTSQQVMFYWFVTRSGALSSEYMVKLDLMKNSLLLRPTDAAFVRLTIPVRGGDVADAQARGKRFLRRWLVDLERALPFDS